MTSCSSLRGHRRTYLTILESADHALFKMVRYVLLRPLRPELDAKTKTCLADGELSSRLDEQANSITLIELFPESITWRPEIIENCAIFYYCRAT
jgi:hypothetical protein